MKIIHVSTHDIRGGAAQGAYRLHTSLCRLGQDSSLFVAERMSIDPTVKAFAPPTDLRSRISRRLRKDLIARAYARYRRTRPAGCELFNDDRTRYGSEVYKQVPACELMHLHWVSRFVDFGPFLSSLPPDLPVVWTLHDMHPFTGGCHFNDGCDRFAERCGVCPQLGSTHEEDLSRKIWRRKQAVLEKLDPSRIQLVAPSDWLAREVKRSSLWNRFPLAVIPYGLDVEVFRPRDRRAARDVLGVREDASVVLCVADWLDNPRKGIRFAVEAMKNLKQVPNRFLIVVGSSRPLIESGVPHLSLDHLSDARLLSMVYSAADVVVVPSVQDNLPHVVIEAMACGVPVIATAVGGIPELIRPRVTGLLVPPQDAGALCGAIANLLMNPALRAALATNSRRVAVEEYSLEKLGQRHLALYTALLHTRGKTEGTAAVNSNRITQSMAPVN